MSRSYKKNPVVKDFNKGEKRIANKRVRAILKHKPDEVPATGSGYKKVYEQWEISDYAFRTTREEWAELYYKLLDSPREWDREYAEKYTFEEWMYLWEKDYKNK